MNLYNYQITDIYTKNEVDNCISLILLNKNKPLEALAFFKFSFYLINVTTGINLDGFRNLFPVEKNNIIPASIVEIKSTDVNDIVYIKLNNDTIIVLTHTFDNYSGDSYQYLRVISKENNLGMTPLNITEYKKFNTDFESENSCDVLDLRFK